MRKLTKLTDEYKNTQNKLDELFVSIGEIMEIEIECNGVKCYPINFDIDDETVTLHPSDGESILSRSGKYKTISFNDFETLMLFCEGREM